MRYFIIAGEKSGDLHGSNLIRGLKLADPEAGIMCWGGEKMEEAGGKLLMHYNRLAFMGFVNVLLNLRAIFRNMALCKTQIGEFSPDVVILIDFPGFNFRIAKFAKSINLKVYYYISPKLWAWKESRVKKVKQFVDRMFIIFPFEVEFYKKHGINVVYYGNPLVDEIEEKKKLMGTREALKHSLGLDDRPLIALLAGSRNHEVKHILPQMVEVADRFSNFQFVLAGVKSINEDLYKRIIGVKKISVIYDKTYELFRIAEAALVKSGTSTLEAAIMDVPQVVCYSGDLISILIAAVLVKVKYFSLVNLIMGRETVKELIQFDNNPDSISKELEKIIIGGSGREKLLSEYDELRKILGAAGASERIALEMVNLLKKS